MRWRKLGLVYAPDRVHPWMMTHAANCAALQIDQHRHRIFFSTRDMQNRASIGFVEIDLREPRKILSVSSTPVLSPGPPGSFDDSGVSLACLVLRDSTVFLYYTGWNLGVTVPWRNSIGLAASADGLHFERVSPAPVLDRNRVDPFSLSYPFVLADDQWRMWYGSNLRWGSAQRDMDHVIKFAVGRGPEDWTPTGIVSIPLSSPEEYALSRPCVMRSGDRWQMWFSHRGAAYRIGYATSFDGVHWHRKDGEAGIEPSTSGWDSESVEYPWVFEHEASRYLLYNGNRYGATGFGIAILESE